jgi:uncharacterized damage-inducible protein DinB
MSSKGEFSASGLLVIQGLNEWIAYQLRNWQDWARERDASWLGLATGNEKFPTLGHLFQHAFSPLRRYTDQAAGLPPTDDAHISAADWTQLTAWAWECLNAHRDLLLGFEPGWLDRPLEFTTRGAGVLRATVGGALTHAATHCVWHLSGTAHLLRSQGIAPPGRSDLLFWLADEDSAGA